MSEKTDEKKGGAETTEAPADAEIKKTVEERVVRHIVEIAKDKDTEGKGNKDSKPAKVKSPTATDLEALQSQLADAEQARIDAEQKLAKSEEQVGTQSDKIDSQKAVLAQIALKAFEDKKKILVDKVRSTSGDKYADEVAETIKGGEDLEKTERWLDIFKDTFVRKEGEEEVETPEKKAPVGKVGMPISMPAGDIQQWNSVEEMVNYVYDNLEEQQFLKDMNMPYDAKKLKKYQSMSNQLLKSLVSGESNREKYDMSWKVIQCPECEKIMVGGETKCPKCGHEILHRREGGIV